MNATKGMNITKGTTKRKRITAAERERIATEHTIALMEWSIQRQRRDIELGIIPPINPDEVWEECYFGVWTTTFHDDGIRRPRRIQGTHRSPPFTKYNPDMDGEEWLNRERVRQLTAIFTAELLQKVKKSN